MPLLRIGYGLIVVAVVAIAAIIASVMMSRKADVQTTLAILGFAASTIAAVLAVVKKLENIEEKQEDYHHQVNSRLTELLRTTKAEGHAEGAKEERDRPK